MLTIGKVAARAGISIDTVRFYERSGLLKKADRTEAGYRLYAADDVNRLKFIRRAKALGFSLEEVAELLALNDGVGERSAVRAIAERRLAELEQKIAELDRVRRTLAGLVQACDGAGPVCGCPIIEAVLGDDTLESKRDDATPTTSSYTAKNPSGGKKHGHS
ncbi:transcriptional regulator, MerR family [Methylocaldum marinum]|uniref:Mercuric resistance operon regulatory protein n=1 Tax=Methylocaldum marinum TaxID=1432792 RepID=A0A250KVZ9_9GAMM|nr:MerR family DNA-binding protein [Methylocaldum marinum]BBA35795.1 transcriptional regulator, MerR family [Methylocaldum marinum]